MCDAQADLVAARVRRLVAEEDQVERSRRLLIRVDRPNDRPRCRLAVPFPSVGLQMEGAVDAQ